MTRRTRIAAVAAASLAVIVACNDNPFLPGAFAVDGRWTGSALTGVGDDTVRFHFDLTLTQVENDLGGSGEVRTATATFPVEIEGRWEYPSVDLVMRSDTTAPLSFDAAFDVDTIPRPAPDSVSDLITRSDTISGTLRGSGLEGVRLEIGRAEP